MAIKAVAWVISLLGPVGGCLIMCLPQPCACHEHVIDRYQDDQMAAPGCLAQGGVCEEHTTLLAPHEQACIYHETLLQGLHVWPFVKADDTQHCATRRLAKQEKHIQHKAEHRDIDVCMSGCKQ